MAKAHEIVERWRNHIPPDVPLSDVEKVIDHYFPESCRKGKGGSHFIKVKDSQSITWAGFTGRPSIPPFDRQGEFTIPVKGKKVKKWYVKDLLEAVKVKENFDELEKK